ncbi:MAG: hypothetical protein ABI273_20670, partial [Lacunisphaera sp.]
MKPTRLYLTAIAIFVFGGAIAQAADNPVLFWNKEALDATRLARNPPPVSSFFFATYHAAIFDAVNGIDHTHQGWLVNELAPAGASMDAAIAAAAHTVMISLWSATTNPHNMQVTYETTLAAIPDSQAKTDGVAWGNHVAKLILEKISTAGYNKPV